MHIICGLGNPGEEYEHTRHNAGFDSVDALAEELRVNYWKNECGALTAKTTYKGEDLLLVKPQGFMNTSGGPLKKVCQAYSATADDVIVIHDELDIPAGDVRVKVGGGHAGHNGLRSIIDKLGSRDFSRIRAGIGNPPGRMPVADFVLKQLRSREAEDFEVMTHQAAEAAALAVTRGVVFARDHVNGGANANGKH